MIGWYQVIDELSEKLEALIKKHIEVNGAENHPRAFQVKEKFAGLRFYMSHYTEEIDKLITKAETDCFKICEHCGKPGELYTRGFWLRTLCEESAQIENKSSEDLPGFIKHSEWVKLVQDKETIETKET